VDRDFFHRGEKRHFMVVTPDKLLWQVTKVNFSSEEPCGEHRAVGVMGEVARHLYGLPQNPEASLIIRKQSEKSQERDLLQTPEQPSSKLSRS
jgi:hypothetical protein